MYLNDVQHRHPQSHWGEAAAGMQAAGIAVPQIMYLFNYKPERTKYLALFSQEVMRGPSPLSPGQRELIAAFTARMRDCVF